MIRTALLLGLTLLACRSRPEQTTHMDAATPDNAPRATRPQRLGAARSWVYQLQTSPHRLRKIAAAPFDVAVVDAADDDGTPWRPPEVAAARQNKLLLAYLSIGEAEDYRAYWQPGWTSASPAWLLGENPNWAGNYLVKYWEADWHNIILGALDEILAQGFDGAYLDVVDAYDNFSTRPQARQEMVDWVCRLSRFAKAKVSDFLVVPQNASELVWHANYSQCIDGTGQEETFYRATNQPTPAAERQARLKDYAEFQRRGKPVFTVDYVDTAHGVRDAYSRARAAGLIEYAADVGLDGLRVNRGFDP